MGGWPKILVVLLSATAAIAEAAPDQPATAAEQPSTAPAPDQAWQLPSQLESTRPSPPPAPPGSTNKAPLSPQDGAVPPMPNPEVAVPPSWEPAAATTVARIQHPVKPTSLTAEVGEQDKSLKLLGGVAFGPDDQVTGYFQLDGEWAFWEPLGLVASVGMQTDRSVDVDGGNASATAIWFDAAFRARTNMGKAAVLFTTGMQLAEVFARSRGFVNDQSAQQFVPGWVNAIELRIAMASRAFIAVRAEGVIRLLDEHFVVNQVVALRVPPLGANLSAGLGWTF